jgi:hypothetical protein
MIKEFICANGCIHPIKIKIINNEICFGLDQIDKILGISNDLLNEFVCKSGCRHPIKIEIINNEPHFEPVEIGRILGISDIFEIIKDYDNDDIYKSNGEIYLTIGGMCRITQDKTSLNSLDLMKWTIRRLIK